MKRLIYSTPTRLVLTITSEVPDNAVPVLITNEEYMHLSSGPAYLLYLKNVVDGRVVDKDAEDISKVESIVLPLLKESHIASINANTSSLICRGFTYSSTTFSLSATAQRNWTALAQAKALLPYPYGVSTLEGDEFFIQTEQEYMQFYMAGLTKASSIIKSGRVLGEAVRSAVTVQGILAIKDTR